MIGLVPDLMKFVPSAKMFTSMFILPGPEATCMCSFASGLDTLVITGGETDVCVLATMLGAIDWGFRVILVMDARAAPRTRRTTR